MKPIIKWAGGKTQLLPILKLLLPSNFKTYYEPFVGGGAMLLELAPATAIVGDTNVELINLYNQLKTNYRLLQAHLSAIDRAHVQAEDKRAYYDKIRDLFNEKLSSNTIEQAARMIYLNKHCFNGLYRVNTSGKFNVPFNGKTEGNSFEEDNFVAVANAIASYSFTAADFEDTVSKAEAGDLVFFDSPYAPVTDTSFTAYTKEDFTELDHRRLAKVFKQLSDRGVFCILTNHDTPLIRELYSDYKFLTVPVKRNINSDASNRTGEEVIITNYTSVYHNSLQEQLDRKREVLRKARENISARDESETVTEELEPKVTKPSATKTTTSTAKKKTTRKKKVTQPVEREVEVEAEQGAEPAPIAPETAAANTIVEEVSVAADTAEPEVSTTEDTLVEPTIEPIIETVMDEGTVAEDVVDVHAVETVVETVEDTTDTGN